MNKLHEWSFVLVSKSPLRIGTDDDELLLDDDGRPFLPGTSWAGACRAYMLSLDKSYEELFGTQGTGGIQHGSRLMFSDGICITPQPFEIRPRVHLDRATKTVHEEKFDQMTVAAGARFKVKLTLRARNDSDKDRVEFMLNALHHGLIRLGAYKSTGGGRVEITDGQYVCYDFSNPEDLEAFVEQSKSGKSWTVTSWSPEFAVGSDFMNMEIEGELVSPLLIAGQYPHDSGKPDRTPIQSMHEGQSRYIIPATSFKGALRHQVARIIRTLSVKPELEDHIFNGRIMLEDIVLKEPKTKIYHRIAINPITGGYKDGALVEEETVSGKFTFSLKLKYDDQSVEDRAAAALLLFALRDFAAGRQTLGSGQGIGRGRVRLSRLKMSHKSKIHGDRTAEIVFGKRCVEDPDKWLVNLQEALDCSVVREGVADEDNAS